MKVYKAIPGPKTIIVDKNGNWQTATNSFADIINAEAKNGWVYHSLENLAVQETEGCFLNKTVKTTNIYMLIFYKEE